jgi:hypothetical protein
LPGRSSWDFDDHAENFGALKQVRMMHAMASHPLSAFCIGLQEIVLKVPMCCAKCEEQVKEIIFDVHGK